MTPISERQCARFYMYKKAKKCETIINIYKKSDTLQKARQFSLRFYSQKSRHFTLRGFYDFFEIDIYIYTKSMTICVTFFYIQKS